ncbi:CD63 antigen [Augochlora pura]
MAATHLDVGLRCIKYLLCAVNSLFVLTGIMIISVGTTIYAVNDDFSKFLDPKYISPATLLIIVGILVFVIAFLGCFGALKESTCMVLIFAVSLSVVLILELAAAITAYALQDDIKGVLVKNINDTMQQYPTDPEARKAIDFLQSRLYCCGYNNYHDWEKIMTEIPESCRVTYGENIACDYDNGCEVYKTGCASNLSILIHRSVLYIGTGAVAIALIQFTGIMFACILGKAIRKQKTERERRRWELRESLVNGYEPLGKSDPLTAFPVVYMYPEPTKNAA